MRTMAGLPSWYHDFIRTRFSKGDIGGLAKALCHREDSVREQAAQALARLPGPRTVTALIAAYRDPRTGHGDTREEILRSLGRVGDPSAVDFLAEVSANDPSRQRRSLALAALRGVGNAGASEPLLAEEALADAKSDDPARNDRAIEVLRQLGPAGVRALEVELGTWQRLAEVGPNPDLGMAEAIDEHRLVRAVIAKLASALDLVRR